MNIEFTVHMTPVAQPRQRHRIIRTKGGKMFAHNYTTDLYERLFWSDNGLDGYHHLTATNPETILAAIYEAVMARRGMDA